MSSINNAPTAIEHVCCPSCMCAVDWSRLVTVETTAHQQVEPSLLLLLLTRRAMSARHGLVAWHILLV